MPAGYSVQREPAGPAGEFLGPFNGHLPEGQWLVSGAANDGMPTKAELFLWHKPFNRWQFGIGLLAKPRTVRWLFNYELRRQQGATPSVTVGVGLQEIGVGNPGGFVTANWALTPWLKIPASAYFGVGRRFTAKGKSLGEGWVPLFGTSVQIVKGVSATVQMDGRKWHGVLTAKVGDARVGLFAFKFKDLGIIVGWQGR